MIVYSSQVSLVRHLLCHVATSLLQTASECVGQITTLDVNMRQFIPMTCPQVLNLGHNQLSGTLDIVGLPALRALMLNDNQLTGVNGERRISAMFS